MILSLNRLCIAPTKFQPNTFALIINANTLQSHVDNLNVLASSKNMKIADIYLHKG